MKSRTLVILGLVLVALAVVVKLSGRKTAPAETGPVKPGAPVFAIDDFNQVAGITIADGTQAVELVKSDNKWTIASSWNHPANFERVADDILSKYALLRVGRVIKASPAELRDFGLDPAATGEDAKKPVVVTLRDAGKKELAVFKLGVERSRPSTGGGMGGYPDSQYVQVGDGPVLLVDENLGRPGATRKDWITTQLLNVNAEQIVDLDVVDKNGVSYGLARDTNMSFYAKQKADKEEVKDEGARSLFGAISYLNVSDVAGPTGAVADAFSGTNSSYRAKTKDGLIYRLDLGAVTGSARYAHLSVSFEAPPPVAPQPVGTNAVDTNLVASLVKAYEDKTAKDKKAAADLQALHAPWLYLIEESATANLTLPREQVIALPPPPTNAPAASATTAEPAAK